MTDHEEQEKPDKKSLGGELILPIGAFIFTLYYFYTIIDVPRIAQISAFFVGTILIFLLILLAIRIGREVKAGPFLEDGRSTARVPTAYPGQAGPADPTVDSARAEFDAGRDFDETFRAIGVGGMEDDHPYERRPPHQ